MNVAQAERSNGPASVYADVPISVPFCDLSRSQPTSELLKVAKSVLASGSFVGGATVEQFEHEFANFCNAKYCVGVNSGTAALISALLTLGIGRGDEVITVAATFVATGAAIHAIGATPVFADIDPRRRTMDARHTESLINSRTCALLPVDLYGQPADYIALRKVAENHGLALVQDAAQAHGASYNGAPVGSQGDVACFSFYPSKNLGALGDAGAVVTNDQAIAENIRRLANHGRDPKSEIPSSLGFNWRMGDLQAGFLSAKLPRLRRSVEDRRKIADQYTRTLSKGRLTLPHAISDSKSAAHLYVVQVGQRRSFMSALRDRGIETRCHYPYALHMLPAFHNSPSRRLRYTENLTRTCVSLPLFTGMTRAEVVIVQEAIQEWEARDGASG